MEGLCDILTRAVLGDRVALLELLKRHGRAARACLAGRIPKRWQAMLSEDDVMQQTFADAVAHIGEFASDSESSFERWLETTARRNLRDALDMLQAEKRGGDQRRIVLGGTDNSLAALWNTVHRTGTTPSGAAMRNENAELLQRAIAALPEAYVHVITLCDLEGRPVDEVAALLERSPGAVFMLRARAHERLRAGLGRTSNFFGST